MPKSSMLHSRKFQKRVFIGLAVLIIPPFVFWGAGSMMHSREDNNFVGTAFGRKITLLEYRDAYDTVRNQAIMQLGDKFDESKKELNLESQAWDWILLMQEAKKRKLSVSDKEVVDSVASQFADKNGVFSERAYNEVLQYYLHVKPREFEEQQRQRLLAGKLSADITKGISLSDKEIADEYRKGHEEVTAVYAAGLSADFAKDINPTETDLKDYFAKNSLDFRMPLSFNAEYIAVPAAEKDSEGASDKIKGIFSRLRRKEPLAKVAKELGVQVKETGLFAENDPLPGIGWMPQVSTLISKTAIGEFITPIYANNSYYLLRLKERKEPYIPEFEKIKDKVKETFIKATSQAAAKEKLNEFAAKAKEENAKNPAFDMEKLAKEMGLKSGVTKPFKFGDYIEGIGISDNFWMTAEALKDNEISEPLTTPAGYYLIKVKTKTPVDEKKFAEEKVSFGKQLLQQKQSEAFSSFVWDLKEKAQRF